MWLDSLLDTAHSSVQVTNKQFVLDSIHHLILLGLTDHKLFPSYIVHQVQEHVNSNLYWN